MNPKVRHAGSTLQKLVAVHVRVLALFSATPLCASSQCDLSPMPATSPIPLMLAVLSLPNSFNIKESMSIEQSYNILNAIRNKVTFQVIAGNDKPQ